MTKLSNNVKDLFDMTGKIALVTGGVRGLGWQAAEALAEAGASVAVTSRKLEAAVQAAEKLCAQTGKTCKGYALEASEEVSWKALIDGVVEEFGRIDVLVNNAGGRKNSITPKQSGHAYGFIEGRSTDDWRYSIDVMLTGVFLGCRTVTPIMKKQKSGKIINIASIDGMRGRDLRLYNDTGLSPTVPDYLASKGAVINLTKGLAVVLAPFGVYVNSISPGGFERAQPQEFIKKYANEVPLGRMGDDTRDLKGPIVFAASAASDYMTGHNLVIDGGWTAW